MQRKKMTKGNSLRTAEPYLLLGPMMILFLIFMLYPMLDTFYLAFQNYRLQAPKDIYFNGINNFVTIFKDPNFFKVLRNSVLVVVVTVGAQFFLGTVLALALKKPFPGRNIYQAVVFSPWAFSGLVIGMTFKWLFNAEFGPINDLLIKAGLIQEKISILGNPKLAIYGIIAALIWYGVPFFGIMLLAAFQSVPIELYESASMDGASRIRQFFAITMPYIKPTMLMTILLRTIWVFNSIDLIFIMTNGGPANATHTLASYTYSRAQSTLDFGMTGALGSIIIFGLGLYSILYLKATNYNEAGDQ